MVMAGLLHQTHDATIAGHDTIAPQPAGTPPMARMGAASSYLSKVVWARIVTSGQLSP
jgi:hypothetical protein